MDYEGLRRHIGHSFDVQVQYGHGKELTTASLVCKECETPVITVDENDKFLFNKLLSHTGTKISPNYWLKHTICCVCYGLEGEDPANIAIECETCGEVVVSYDRDYPAEVKK